MPKYIYLLLFLFLPALSAQAQRTGKDYAVFFYVTDFIHPLKDLPDTKAECRALAKELEENYDFSCVFVEECKRADIERSIKQWNQRLLPNDQVLFFFSMHGYYAAGSDRGYLIPADGQPNAQYNYYESWLSYDDLRTLLEPCKAAHVLVALDACYSGSFGIRSHKNYPDGDPEPPDEACAGRISRSFKYRGRQFITAGKTTETAPGKSLFAAEILNSLRSAYDAHGVLALDDLAHRLHKLRSPEPEDGKFTGHSEGADFLFIRKNACAATPYEAPEVKLLRDAAAWNKANTEKNYAQYLRDWCPGGAFCAAAEAELAKSSPVEAEDPFGMVLIKGGTFTMGCTSEQQDCESDEKPTHRVTLSDFYMGKHEVTQRQWQEVMGSNPARFNDCPDCPVEQVSWDDIQTFLQKLNTRHPGRNYRLPTEAEWEYAAREGGKAVLFGNGKNILDPAEANFGASADYKKPYSVVGEYRQKTTPVGSFRPNALGLYDMAGNVWEWCSDGKGAYPSEAQTNPQGPASGSFRVLRGGSWSDVPQGCRVADRSSNAPGNRYSYLGFRLSRTP